MKPISNPTDWRQDESLREIGERLSGRPADIQAVSFDFFDTLVSRMCEEPADLFIELGRRLAKRDLLRAPLSPVEFRAARIAADEQARGKAAVAKRSSEITLADIYAELSQVVRDAAAACQLEFEVERLFCYLNPAMASLVEHVRSLGYRTALVSDTYFTSAQLVEVLKENGLSADRFDALFASSERAKTKSDGHLYHDVFHHFDIQPCQLLHIGDNTRSDVSVPRGLGVQTVHYYRTTAAIEGIFKSERTLRGTNIHPSGSLNSLRVLTARRAENLQDPFRDGAWTFGPLLSRFADWAARRFAAAGVRKVMALMREGELLGELLQNAAVSAGIPLEVIPCYASRLATGRAALPEVNALNAAGLLDGGVGVTAQAIMVILGLGEEARKGLGAPQADKVLNSPKSIAQFLQLLFNQPGLRAKIEARHKEDFQLAFDYLTGLAGKETQIGIIDLGWSGSIQRNIGRILRRGGGNVRTTGCYLACSRRSGRLALEGDTTHAYMDEDWGRSPILPESAITACVGSTNSYARNQEGKVVPVLGSIEFTAEERQVKARLREGILAFQSLWLSLCARKGAENISSEMYADMDRHAAAILYRLLDYPTKGEGERLGDLRHDENYFGTNHSAPLCDTASPSLLRQRGIGDLYRVAQYWPQGVVARQYPRVISTLREGWSNPIALGRLGATHALTPVDATLTDGELASLASLLAAAKVEQVVFCGALTSTVEELFRFLWHNEGKGPGKKPRLIVAGSADGGQHHAGFMDHVSVVTGDPAEPSTLRSIRSQLITSGPVALVLADETASSKARPLLNGLTPFLGASGIILAACGRYDRDCIEGEALLAAPVDHWWKSVGKEIGYTRRSNAATATEYQCNWIILQRVVQEIFWNRQWMFYPGDATTKLEAALTASS